MANVSRTGDVGTGRCPAHDSTKTYNTVFMSGSIPQTAEGSPIVRVGDVGISSCGHPTVALSGAPTSRSASLDIHRIGDVGSNPGAYVSLSGATTVFAY